MAELAFADGPMRGTCGRSQIADPGQILAAFHTNFQSHLAETDQQARGDQ